MRNSKKQIILAIAFCLVALCGIWLLNYLLVPYSTFDRRTDAYLEDEAKGNVDVLVVGSSLEEDGVDGETLGQELGGLHGVVFAPNGGFPESSYDLLLMASKRNNVKIVVVGWTLLQNYQYPEYVYPRREELYRELLPLSKHNHALRKRLLEGLLKQRYTSTFFEYAAFPESTREIPAVLKSKKPENMARIYPTRAPMDLSKLKDKEDPYNYIQAINRKYRPIEKAEDVEYLRKIKDYCDAHGIKVFLHVCALPQVTLDAIPNVSALREAAHKLSDNVGIPLIDGFSFPDATDNSHFGDAFGHLASDYRPTYAKYMAEAMKPYL